MSEGDLADAYEQVMVILFRLLFVAYAEDKDLLPYRNNGRYADHSLSSKARMLAQHRRQGRAGYDEQATDLWDDVNQLWDAVNYGNGDWGVPAYNGGLFSFDPDVSPSGAAIAGIKLSNAEFGPALSAVLVDEGVEGPGPVDFRSLSVREFGTIYEGLLESKLSVAQDDLAVKVVKGKEQYVPASGDDEDVEVDAGAVYFHNRSGVRKATGSYFTKPFAVEHLLDNALEPALDDHIARLDELRERGDDAALAEAFFDFRCADIAMGSAHFLVAAVDRIEARLSAWLTLHPVPAVTAELNRLRTTALDALGDLADGVEIAGRLAAVDDRFAEWAAEVGVPVGSANDEAVKQDLICELDACVAYLYGLNEDDLAVVYETFSETVDYSERHAAVLTHFRRLTG